MLITIGIIAAVAVGINIIGLLILWAAAQIKEARRNNDNK